MDQLQNPNINNSQGTGTPKEPTNQTEFPGEDQEMNEQPTSSGEEALTSADLTKTTAEQSMELESAMDTAKLPETATTSTGGSQGSGKPELKEKPLRLVGSQRKRLKWLLGHGHSFSEAKELCKKTVKEREGKTTLQPQLALKRVRFETSTPSAASNNKRPKSELAIPSDTPSSGLSYASVAAGVFRVGILPRDYPEAAMTLEQQNAVKDKLRNLIVSTKHEPPLRFRGTSFRCGHIVVSCADKSTADWVASQEPQLCLPELQLKVVGDEGIPGTHTVTGYFPDSLDFPCEKICDIIGNQNRVSCKSWKTLKRKDTGKNCLEVIFAIDDVSYKALRDLNFMIEYVFGTVQLHPRGGKRQEGATGASGAPIPMVAAAAGGGSVPSEKASAAAATAEPNAGFSGTNKPAPVHPGKPPLIYRNYRINRTPVRSARQEVPRPLMGSEDLPHPTCNKGKPWVQRGGCRGGK